VQGTWYKVRGRKFRVQVSRYQVNALGKRLKAKGSRWKRGSDAIVSFKVQPCLYPPPPVCSKRKRLSFGEKFQIDY
jgi:hypothetical protein